MRTARALAASLATLVLALPGIAVGQPAEQPDVRLVVTGVPSMLGDGAPRPSGTEPQHDLDVRLLVLNEGIGEVEDLAVFVEVFDAVSSRSELHAAVDNGRALGRLLEGRVVDVADGGPVGAGSAVGVEVTVPGDEIGWSETGVHPVRVSVIQGRTALDEATTAVTYLATVPAVPLPTMVAWPLDGAPLRAPGDVYPSSTVQALRTGSRLERLVWALERNPAAAVQPLLGAHLIEDLADMADGFVLQDGTEVEPEDEAARTAAALLERIRAVIAAEESAPVASAYADADLAGLVRNGLLVEGLQDVAEGRRRLEEAVQRRPSPDALWATTPLDPTTLRALLIPSRVRSLVLSWRQVRDGDVLPDRTPAPVHVLRAGGSSVEAAVADPWLEGLLARVPDQHGRLLGVHRILAETAFVQLERPFGRDRGLVLLPPPDWEPDPRLANDLLRGLQDAPWLELVGLDELLLGAAGAAPRAQLDGTEQSGLLTPDLAGAIARARDRVGALQDALAEPGGAVGGLTWEELDQQLLRASSRWLTGGAADAARAHIVSVDEAVADGYGQVSLPPDVRITLTDTEGDIPVSVARTEGRAIRVLVSVGPSPKLEFPDGSTREITLEEGTRQTISFRAESQAGGRIPITVTVSVPTGIGSSPPVVLARETLVVQSTAISRTALTVLGIVLGLLFLWWVWRRLRPKPPQLVVVREEAA